MDEERRLRAGQALLDAAPTEVEDWPEMAREIEEMNEDGLRDETGAGTRIHEGQADAPSGSKLVCQALMVQLELERTITSFFVKAGGPALLLPDGWFGRRPMEGHHDLSFVSARPKRLLIELDNQLLLSIVGSPQIEETVTDLALTAGTSTLVIEGFSQAVFEYLEYVNETPQVTSYTEGRISFVAPT